MKSNIKKLAGVIAVVCIGVPPVIAGQDGTMTALDRSLIVAPLSAQTNPWTVQVSKFVCGGKAQAGTPIAGNGTSDSNGTEGRITISGIPITATIERADLMWTVLTYDSSDTTIRGQSIFFNGTPVTANNIGRANEGPCFLQPNSIAWRADVTSLVTAPGNGSYSVGGFPGGSDFTEGVTLQILWRDANGALVEDNLYHAGASGKLAVTQSNTFSQALNFSPTNASGPVSSTFYTVFGNGQTNGTENLRFDGLVTGDIDLDNTLDGSTVAYAPNTCNSTYGTQCFWDDDVHVVSAQMTNSATSASITSSGGSDCITWPAASLVNTVDPGTVCAAGGKYVDRQCPTTKSWKNHGEYVSCVAHAAEEFLSGLPYGGSCPREDTQSCIVNPRARSDVGKKK